MAKSNQPGVLFFLGAGASVGANVPTTRQFVGRYLEVVEEENLDPEGLKALLARLSEWRRSTTGEAFVDVELLLEAFDRLQGAESDVMLAMVDGGTLGVSAEQAEAWESRLRTFIREQTWVARDKVGYVHPLLAFSEGREPLDVFTTNYDIVVEQSSALFGYSCTDGFAGEWESERLDAEAWSVRLHKLHGSITWFRSERGRYLHLPIRIAEPEVELISEETAAPVLSYPAQKPSMIAPLLDLHARLQHHLGLVSIAYVAGYTFRDDHLRDIFWDAAQANPHLFVVLVDPDAAATFETRLRRYPTGTLSPLANRTICLPDRFETWLERVRERHDHFVSLRDELAREGRAERDYGHATWATALGHVSRWDHGPLTALVLERLSGGGYDGMQILLANWRRLIWSALTRSAELCETAMDAWTTAVVQAFGTDARFNFGRGAKGTDTELTFEPRPGGMDNSDGLSVTRVMAPLRNALRGYEGLVLDREQPILSSLSAWLDRLEHVCALSGAVSMRLWDFILSLREVDEAKAKELQQRLKSTPPIGDSGDATWRRELGALEGPRLQAALALATDELREAVAVNLGGEPSDAE